MNIYRFTLMLVGSVSLGVLISCTDSNTVDASSELAQLHQDETSPSAEGDNIATETERAAHMPGSAISFSHDYEGESDPHVREEFRLRVRKPAWGDLRLELSTSGGLSLFTDANQTFESGESVVEVPIEFLADSNGSYKINAVAIVTSEDSPMRLAQAYTMSVQVGSPEIVSQSSQVLVRDSEGEAIVVRSAKETIE